MKFNIFSLEMLLEIDLFSVHYCKVVLFFGILKSQNWYLWLFSVIFGKISQNKSRNFCHLARFLVFWKKSSSIKEVISKTEETMAVNPNYEQIGKAFTQQYYALFDNAAQRPQLAALYNVRNYIFKDVNISFWFISISRGF